MVHDRIAGQLRRSAVTERAPAHLRLQIDELSAPPGRRGGAARRLVPVPAAAVALAGGVIAVVGLVLVLSAPARRAPRSTPPVHGRGGPTVAQAAVLGAQPITYSPLGPGASRAAAVRTDARLADVRIPTGLAGGGWTFQAWRISRLDGRQVLTVYYSRAGRNLVYLIAGGPSLRGQRPGLRSFTSTGAEVVSWLASEHSCLLIGPGASRTTLLELARS